MHARLLALWSTLRSAYWFIPTVMALGAVVLAIGSVKLDEYVRGDVSGKLGWVYSGGPEGARAVLATIAGSIITVAGTTFSITIAAFSLASSQFGPRLLRTFRRDTGNQIVLGAFISTFLYCLLVLRTVRGTETDTYVPHLSVTLGVLLAGLSLAFLIYFIHHTAASIQVSHLIDIVGEELETAILQNCPTKEAGMEESDSAISLTISEDCPHTVLARRGGYLLYIDYEGLMEIGVRKKCIIQVMVKPGDFIIPDMPLVVAFPQTALEDSDSDQVVSTMNLGTDRTPAQDLEFACLQLAEIAVRALSPGINDPFTAITCIDRISSALCLLEERALPAPRRRDADGNIRLIAEVVTYPQLVQSAFLHIRTAAKSNAWVLKCLYDRITFVLSRTHDEAFQSALLQERALALRDMGVSES